jgi:ribosomal protein L32
MDTDDMKPTWWERRRKRKYCFHHQVPGFSNEYTTKSYIQSHIIETGKAKMFWCEQELGGCGETWVI